MYEVVNPGIGWLQSRDFGIEKKVRDSGSRDCNLYSQSCLGNKYNKTSV
jgi:hypothetical protein